MIVEKKKRMDMEFLDKLPRTAVMSPDGDRFSYTDRGGQEFSGFRVTLRRPGSETVTCNVSGEQLERVTDSNGNLNRSKVIHLFPQARSLLARHSQAQRISFSATLKHANYQFQEVTGKSEKRYKATVFDNNYGSRVFTGTDRKETMDRALTWMEQYEEATIALTSSQKQEVKRTLVSKDHYEGRKNLTNVEVELHLEYLTIVETWLVIPEGVR